VHIERVRVEAGFLDGLDLRLVRGLNVVIGARGTGKTSLIELIRFCLNVKGHTAESNQQSLDHALSILDFGEVTVDIDDDGAQGLPLVSQRSEAVAGTRGAAFLGPRDGAKSAKGRR
jgi:Fe-S cluster assembly ATPase SufC